MPKIRRLTIVAALCLGLAPACAAAAAPYAPVDTPGPPLDVAQAPMADAMQCSAGLDHTSRAPVLLLPGTGASARDNWSWNYEPQFDKLGIPWCALTFPYNGNGDVQVNGEYVVYAIRTMYARAAHRISIVGHSQGGMVGRWALRFWPDTRNMVEDVIGFAPTNHGTTQAGTCSHDCLYANWQQAYESNFIRALNSYQETFPGIAYTNVYSHTDEVVRPNADDTGSSSLHGGGGRIANIAIQDICPLAVSEHFLIGTIDPTAYAVAIDALDHDGPADPGRIDHGVCTQPYMPGIEPVGGTIAGLQGLIDDQTSTGPTANSEPPLACYVFAACPSQQQPVRKAASACVAQIALPGSRVVAATLYVDGRRRTRLHGHRLRSVKLTGVGAGPHSIRVAYRTSNGHRHVLSRRVVAC